MERPLPGRFDRAGPRGEWSHPGGCGSARRLHGAASLLPLSRTGSLPGDLDRVGDAAHHLGGGTEHDHGAPVEPQPLRVVEDLDSGTVVELHLAAPDGVSGAVVVDLGLVEV